MKHENRRNLAVPTEMRWNSHVYPGRIQVRQLMQAQGRLVAVDALHHLIAIL
ncbi:MAG: hypothetical protein ACRD4G_01425 [Bryobacteraceae bacterium]